MRWNNCALNIRAVNLSFAKTNFAFIKLCLHFLQNVNDVRCVINKAWIGLTNLDYSLLIKFVNLSKKPIEEICVFLEKKDLL